MAAITAAASGNWSSTSTWSGGVVPGNGDTADIQGYNVTVDVDTIIGTSPGTSPLGSGQTTDAVHIADGTLTIAAGKKLTVRGDIGIRWFYLSKLVLNAGARVEFDTSLASSPSTTVYVVDMYDAAAQGIITNQLIINGTSGARCYFGIKPGGAGACRVTGGAKWWSPGIPSYSGGYTQATYCDFYKVGTSTLPAWDFRGESDTGSAFMMKWDHCRFDTCGAIKPTLSLNANVGFDLSNSTFINSVGEYNWYISGGDPVGSNSTTNGVIRRWALNTVFDKPQFMLNVPTLTAPSGSIFAEIDNAPSGGVSWNSPLSGSIENCFFRKSNVQTDLVLQWGTDFGGTTGNYWVTDYVSGTDDNPHYLQLQAFGSTGNTYLRNSCFEYTGTANNGDIRSIAGAPSGGTTSNTKLIITGNIALPNGGGEHAGDLFSILSGTYTDQFAIQCSHNTMMIGQEGAATISEGANDFAGEVDWFKDNLCWDTSARGYALSDIGSDLAITDAVLASNIHHNGRYNALTGSCKLNGVTTSTPGYNLMEFSAASPLPGANDVTANPSFVAADRNIAKWDLSLGGPGTVAHAVAQLAKLNDSDWDSRYSVANLLTYVRNGFAPTNTAYQATASDGGDIGAVAVVASSAATGSGSYTEAVDTGAGTGTRGATGSGSYTESADAGSGSGASGSAGSGSYTEGTDTGAGSGSAFTGAGGSGGYTESPDAGSGSGTTTAGPATGSGSYAEVADAAAGTGASGSTGSGGYVEAGDTGSNAAPTTAPGGGAGYTLEDWAEAAKQKRKRKKGKKGGELLEQIAEARQAAEAHKVEVLAELTAPVDLEVNSPAVVAPDGPTVLQASDPVPAPPAAPTAIEISIKPELDELLIEIRADMQRAVHDIIGHFRLTTSALSSEVRTLQRENAELRRHMAILSDDLETYQAFALAQAGGKVH